MSKNENLHAAKVAKNDEFYTQYDDIEKEMNAYIEYNHDVSGTRLCSAHAMIRSGQTLPNTLWQTLSVSD